jgi:hypothetical protein
MTWRGRSPAPSRSPSHPRPPYPAVHRQGARKGRYITRVFVSSSMGPGIELELPSVLPGGARFFSRAAAPPPRHAAAVAAFDAFCGRVDAPAPDSRELRRARLLPAWRPRSRYAHRFPNGRRRAADGAPEQPDAPAPTVAATED